MKRTIEGSIFCRNPLVTNELVPKQLRLCNQNEADSYLAHFYKKIQNYFRMCGYFYNNKCNHPLDPSEKISSKFLEVKNSFGISLKRLSS